MGVERGGFSRVVAEVLLDEAEVDAGFQQVCGIRMPQRMNRSGSWMPLWRRAKRKAS